MKHLIEKYFIFPRMQRWYSAYAYAFLQGRLKGKHSPHQIMNFNVITWSDKEEEKIVNQVLKEIENNEENK